MEIDYESREAFCDRSGTDRKAVYTNLDPGDYVFRVRGSNNNGLWNEAGASIRITILPPWRRTWWAYTFYGLFSLGILYGPRRYEMNRQQFKHQVEIEHLQAEKEHVEAEKLKEIDNMKSRFFANISHEFRTPLTLVMGRIENVLPRQQDNKTRKTKTSSRWPFATPNNCCGSSTNC